MRRGLLASEKDFQSLRERISRKPFDTIYDTLRRRCSLILETAPVTETQWRSLWQQGSWAAALNAARTTQGRLMDLVVAHRIDPNPAFRDRAIEELKNLVSWSTWVDPCHPNLSVDLCTAEAAVGAVVGLDWLWDELGGADRLRVMQAIRHRVIEPYRQAVAEQAWWYDCYHSWNAVVNSGCGLAALALSDEEPAGEQAYRAARAGLKHFFEALGREGGWDEGVGYWGYAMRYVLLLGEAVSRSLDDQSIFHSRGMDTTGLFPVYFTPNGQSAGFGDAPSVPLMGTFYLLVRHFGVAELTWWLDTYSFHRDVSTTGWSAAGLAMLFRPVDIESPDTANLLPVKTFHEIGWACMADRWPRPEFYVSAKTGDLSAHQSQRNMNSIQLQVNGEMLLTALGPAPSNQEHPSQERDDLYEVQAQAHNTLTVGVNDHIIDAQGAIVDAQSGKDFRWLACDAQRACGENVRFIRHLIMIVEPDSRRGRMLIVLDEVTNPLPERVDLYWHTAGKIDLNVEKMSGCIVGRQAEVNFLLAASVSASVSTETRKSHRTRTDHLLQLTTGPTQQAVFVSLFSPEKLPETVGIKRTSGGGLRLTVGDLVGHFKYAQRHLQLEEIKK